MKTYRKVSLIGLVVGALFLLAGFTLGGFKISALSSGGEYETTTFSAEEEVKNIRIDAQNADVTFVRAEEGAQFSVSYEENDRHRMTASLTDGTFSLVSSSSWFWENFFRLQFSYP